MNHNSVKIAQLCMIVLYIQIITCDIDYLFEERFVIRNTDPNVSISLSATFNSDEVDDASLEWADSSSSPGLDYYFIFILKSFQPRVATIALGWNTERTYMARKNASGTLLFTVKKNSLPVGNKTLEVVVHWKPETASVLRNPSSGNIFRDSILKMTCSADKGYPNGNVTWKINGTVMTGDMYGTDEITINAAQAEHDGDWSCYFTNGLGSGNESEIQTVEVKWKPGSCNLTVNPDDEYINCGDTLRMFCTCPDTGKPMGHINWFLNGNNKTEMYTSDNITLHSVESKHDGQWECDYKNEIGYGTSSSKIVNVRCRPKGEVELVPDSYVVKRGQTVRLECKGDPGSPKDKVLLKLDSNVVGDIPADEENIWNIKPSRNGTWSCLFMNELGNGSESNGVDIGVLLTYLPPNIELKVTAVSSTIGIASNETMTTGSNTRKKRMTASDEPRHRTIIELTGNGESLSIIQPLDISEYTFYNLQPETSYNISVFYNNSFGDGEPAFETFTTKPLPLLKAPSITRTLLTAVVQMTIEKPDSASVIAISVCSIGETDSRNCNTENVSVVDVEFHEGVYGTFSKRYVNVTIYDSGVPVYSYGQNIDLALVVIILIVLATVVLVGVIIAIIIIVIKKKDRGKKKQDKEEEETIDPYSYSNPNNESGTGTGPAKALNAPLVDSVVKKGKPLEPIAASQADGPIYSKVDWSKKNSRQSLRGSPMSKKAIDKIMFDKNDGKINMQFEVSKKFTGDIEIDVCREGGQSSTSKVPKQHVRGTKNVVMVLPIKETSQDKYAIHMKFIAKGQMVQEVDLTYPYEQNSVHVTVLNDAYVTSGADVKAQEMPDYSEVNKSKKTKAAEEQLYEDVETKNQSSHNDRSTNAVSPSNAEVAVEGVPSHPPRKGAPKEGVMYAELDLNSSGAPRLLPRLGSKSPAQEPVIYADVRPGQNDVV